MWLQEIYRDAAQADVGRGMSSNRYVGDGSAAFIPVSLSVCCGSFRARMEMPLKKYVSFVSGSTTGLPPLWCRARRAAIIAAHRSETVIEPLAYRSHTVHSDDVSSMQGS